MSKSFLEFELASGALWLSPEPTRKLKSGRMSPYFFDPGSFSTGQALSVLARAYADAIQQAEIGFNVVFGPAYKGTLLAPAVAMALWQQHPQRRLSVGYASNRKEEKDHGEGGTVLGARLAGMRAVIVDDVITNGGAKREAIEFVRAHGGTPVAVVVAFDRQERGINSDLSAAQEVEREFGIPVIAVATTTDLIQYLRAKGKHAAELEAILAYQSQYGVKQ